MPWRVSQVSLPGQEPYDKWSWAHLGTGLFMGLAGLGALLVIFLLVAYEAVEAGLRRVRAHGKGIFEHESWPNIAADVLLGLLGWILVIRWTPFDILPWAA